jgi:capsular polysaccharide biosynthesis protein
MQFSNLINMLNPRAPKGVIWRAEDWVRIRGTPARQLRHPQPEAWMREVFPPEHTLRSTPPAKVRSPAEEFSELRWTSNPAANLYYLKGCRILGDEGTVISPDNRVFADFTMPPNDRWLEHSCFKRRRIPPATRLKGWYATIAWPEAKVFFHWMIESLPRMAVLEEMVGILDGIFVPGPLQEYQVECMAALGVCRDKLIALDARAHYEIDHLFVPHTYAMYNPPGWMHSWFKRAYLQAEHGHRDERLPKRLYISRADAPHRRLENEPELLPELAALGFVAVRLSEMPFQEQARLFNAAQIIVAPHGAGLAHLLFCRPGTQVLEIIPAGWMPPAFMPLALSAGCDYRYMLSEGPTGHGADSRFGHSHVSVAAVIKHVQEMIDSRAPTSRG